MWTALINININILFEPMEFTKILEKEKNKLQNFEMLRFYKTFIL